MSLSSVAWRGGGGGAELPAALTAWMKCTLTSIGCVCVCVCVREREREREREVCVCVCERERERAKIS